MQAHEQIYSGRPVGGFTFQQDGSLLLFMDRGTVATWRDGKLTERIPSIATERASRFNDVIADPAGRVFCGTMSSGEGKGRLYRLDLDGSLHVVLEEIGCSNGMAFTADRESFYYTDSFAREIYRFDYKVADGSLRNQRLYARLGEADGLPDGCLLDSEDRLWAALWGGNSVARVSEDGTIAERVLLPVPQVSSVTYGGDTLGDLYMTTAGGHDKEHHGPLAGALFRLRSHGQGRAEFFSRITFPCAG
jgi:D-xylonolactonase